MSSSLYACRICCDIDARTDPLQSRATTPTPDLFTSEKTAPSKFISQDLLVGASSENEAEVGKAGEGDWCLGTLPIYLYSPAPAAAKDSQVAAHGFCFYESKSPKLWKQKVQAVYQFMHLQNPSQQLPKVQKLRGWLVCPEISSYPHRIKHRARPKCMKHVFCSNIAPVSMDWWSLSYALNSAWLEGSSSKLATQNFSPYLVNGVTKFLSKGFFPIHLQPNVPVHSPPLGSDIRICTCKIHQSSRAIIVYPQFQLVQEVGVAIFIQIHEPVQNPLNLDKSWPNSIKYLG